MGGDGGGDGGKITMNWEDRNNVSVLKGKSIKLFKSNEMCVCEWGKERPERTRESPRDERERDSRHVFKAISPPWTQE